ncbi:hypothetical protein HPB50_000271 [Hyalomma asiaticum]|uniref:Uncharacterized protein n=1 Tax=Hyalomma asiaticum TaxID=266040 RepID=A0ACB7S9N7_HYAAI|nr:hypothetical protein HPB50_000271 [Hyalomma asiaticum]
MIIECVQTPNKRMHARGPGLSRGSRSHANRRRRQMVSQAPPELEGRKEGRGSPAHYGRWVVEKRRRVRWKKKSEQCASARPSVHTFPLPPRSTASPAARFTKPYRLLLLLLGNMYTKTAGAVPRPLLSFSLFCIVLPDIFQGREGVESEKKEGPSKKASGGSGAAASSDSATKGERRWRRRATTVAWLRGPEVTHCVSSSLSQYEKESTGSNGTPRIGTAARREPRRGPVPRSREEPWLLPFPTFSRAWHCKRPARLKSTNGIGNAGLFRSTVCLLDAAPLGRAKERVCGGG